jgi:hypothetical protein
LVLSFTLLALGCGGESEPTSAQATSGAERGPGPSGADSPPSKPQPLPAPFEATFSLPVRLPLRAIAAQLDAQLPEHEARGLGPLTAPGKSPALEASYDIWRDPVTLRYARGVLEIDVPLRYAARFNARVKSPFGGWLTVAKNEPWGTRDDPQRVTLRVHTKVKVSKQWELRLRSKVEPPAHGAPPDGKLCTGGSFKLCVSKASIAPEVRRRLDAEIIPRMQQALDEVDQRLPALVALRSRIEQGWQLLSEPRPWDDHGRWVLVEPRQAALTLRAGGDAISVEPAVFARVSYHEAKPQPASTPLPDKTKLSELPGEHMPLPAELVPEQLRLLLTLLGER